MSKNVIIFGLAVFMLLIGAHAAFASSEFCILGLICIPLPGPPSHNPAPAPLLAAGIPAFTALGGGVLLSRVARKVKRWA